MAIADAPTKQSAASRIGQEFGGWSPSLRIGSAIFLVILLAGIFAPLLTPYDPYYQDYNSILLAPNWAHPFGTDMNGRDILTRVLYGIRIDLQISFIITFVPMTYGVFIGAASGYLGGKLDTVVMRILDIAIAFPFLVLIIVIIAILGPGVHNIYAAVCLVGWTMYARLARAEMLVERGKDYILAARVLGFGQGRVMFGHALPNIINSSIVFSMSDFVLNILLLSGLSFLGLGVAPPEPEWGAMIAESKDYMRQAWWVTTMPALAIVLTGTALSLIGDGLAQRLGQNRRGLM
ncbi:MAG TPA: ABC transporter permease [Verrucomicrobiae bacterium]|jgi:peptide/nickel transport system permease protein|nr:ABC transporter permease [Verrucomicrobiae bacterium]